MKSLRPTFWTHFSAVGMVSLCNPLASVMTTKLCTTSLWVRWHILRGSRIILLRQITSMFGAHHFTATVTGWSTVATTASCIAGGIPLEMLGGRDTLMALVYRCLEGRTSVLELLDPSYVLKTIPTDRVNISHRDISMLWVTRRGLIRSSSTISITSSKFAIFPDIWRITISFPISDPEHIFNISNLHFEFYTYIIHQLIKKSIKIWVIFIYNKNC